MGRELLTFLGLLMVFEGALYALFPRAYLQGLAEMARWPERRLRLAGLAVAVAGAALLAWLSGGEPEALGFGEIRRVLAMRVAL